MTADEAIERVRSLMQADEPSRLDASWVHHTDLRALLAEIERLRARVAELEGKGKQRVWAFAAQYQGGDLAHGTVADTERGTWERLESPWFGVGREQFEAEGWRVVPVTIEWEDGDADE